jgi:hypothetical protein
MHGSLWNFLRNDALDARRFFDISRAKLRNIQFGASIGGPVLKNRLFYFGSWQGLRIRQEQSSTSAFPRTEAERRGDYTRSAPAPVDPLTNQAFPGAQIPVQRFDPVAVKLLSRLPLPNDPSGRLSALVAVPNDGDDVVGKVDWNPREKDRLSVRYYWDYSRGLNAFPVVVSPGSNIPGYSPSPQTQNMPALTTNHTRTWTTALLTVTRGTYSKFDYLESNPVTDTLEQPGARFPVAAGPPRLPQIVVQGRFSASPGRSNSRIGTNYDFSQDWTWQRGAHELKWGAQVQRHGYARLNDSASSGRLVFDGTFSRNPMADFLLGRIVSFTQNSLQQQQGYYYIPALYVQDNWKASRRLTINLGLRWEVYTPWRESQGQQSAYIAGVQSRTFPNAPRGAVYQADPEFNYNTDGVNLGPRVGFAWDVSGDGKTSLRGGYALSFDGIIAESRLDGNQPFTLDIQATNAGPLSNPYANVANPFPYAVDPQRARFITPMQISTNAPYGLESMYNHNVSLTLERQLTQNLMWQVAYMGNFGRKILNAWQFNPAVYRPGATTRDTEARRLLAPNFGAFVAYTSDAVSSYNAMQTQMVKRFSKGFTVLANYSYSRAIDDACTSEVMSDCRQQDPFNRSGSRGLSDHDRTHIAAISYVFELPFFRQSRMLLRQTLGGWRLSGVNRFQSGVAFTVFTGADVSLTGVNNDRPDVLRSPALPSDRPRQEKLNRWFDTAAFARNQPGQYGNAGRNIIRGPGTIFFDASLQKEFPTFERQKLEFRADLFNVLNRANFNNPANNLSTPASFGRITGTGSARVVQLALRYEF